MMTALATLGCDDPTGSTPGEGVLRISVTSAGTEVDEDGFLVHVDSLAPVSLRTGESTIRQLVEGAHRVRLTAIAGYCTLDGGPDRQVDVSRGDTTDIVFKIDCAATGVRVTITTTGIDTTLTGYSLRVDGSPGTRVRATGEVTLSRLAPGDHMIWLDGLPRNCAAKVNVPVNLARGVIIPIAFQVECRAATAVVAVLLEAIGKDADAGDLYLVLDDQDLRVVLPGERVYFPVVAVGDHAISFSSAVGNCSAGEGEPQPVNVPSGPSRDTVEVIVSVTCRGWPIVRVTAPTTGVPQDHKYVVTVARAFDDYPGLSRWIRLGQIANGDTVSTTDRPGSIRVRLGQLDSRCTVMVANPTPLLNLRFGDTLDVTFPVVCKGGR